MKLIFLLLLISFSLKAQTTTTPIGQVMVNENLFFVYVLDEKDKEITAFNAIYQFVDTQQSMALLDIKIHYATNSKSQWHLEQDICLFNGVLYDQGSITLTQNESSKFEQTGSNHYRRDIYFKNSHVTRLANLAEKTLQVLSTRSENIRALEQELALKRAASKIILNELKSKKVWPFQRLALTISEGTQLKNKQDILATIYQASALYNDSLYELTKLTADDNFYLYYAPFATNHGHYLRREGGYVKKANELTNNHHQLLNISVFKEAPWLKEDLLILKSHLTLAKRLKSELGILPLVKKLEANSQQLLQTGLISHIQACTKNDVDDVFSVVEKERE